MLKKFLNLIFLNFKGYSLLRAYQIIECKNIYLKGKSIDENNIYAASVLDLDVIQSGSRREYRREVLQNFIIRSILKSLGKNNIEETIQKFDNKVKSQMESTYV